MSRRTILTFYSYKGGTGRSMTVANTAWILASNGLRVLVVDWDLEAPGLHRYFHPFLGDPELRTSAGLIDLFWAFAEAAVDPQDAEAEADEDWHKAYARVAPYAMSIDHPFPGSGTVDLLPAGRQDASYAGLVTAFDWDHFYERLGGGGFIEALKRDMRDSYDYVLIDSRTGLSDTSGICTVQMPDVLVDCFSLGTQAVDGAAAAARSAQLQRNEGQLKVFPVPMRVEDAERDRLDASRDYARARFGRLLAHVADPDRYWGDVEIPYKSFYAYEELLATIGDRPRQPNTVLAATERLVGYLTEGQVEALRPTVTEADRRELIDRFQRQAAHPVPSEARRRLRGRGLRVFISYGYESPQHYRAVCELWYLLRDQGVDARVDHPPGQRRPDWPAWLADELQAADVVLVVASPGNKPSGSPGLAEDRTAHPGGDEPRPADILRDECGAADDPYVPIVLPGGSTSDVPAYLTGPRFRPVELEALSPEGIEPLLPLVFTPLAPQDDALPPAGTATWGRTPVAHSPELADALDRLRGRVAAQLSEEAPVGRSSSSLQLPVRWRLLRTLGRTASRTARFSTPDQPRSGGTGESLYQAYLALPSGQMLLLGEPGSGKTEAARECARRLLEAGGSHAPVPVPLSAATWRPDRESLDFWIARRLREDYVVPGEPRPMRELVAELVAIGGVLPVLDGLDELPGTLVDQALEALREAPLHRPFLVTCRSAAYREAAARTGPVPHGTTVVELRGVTPRDAAAYLQSGAAPDDARWRPVLNELRHSPDAPVSQALSSPLMLQLAATTYRPPQADPRELLSFSADGIRARLFRMYIPAVYGSRARLRGGARAEYRPRQPLRWLYRLATWQSEQGESDISWWRLHTMQSRWTSRLLLASAAAMAGLLAMVLSTSFFDLLRAALYAGDPNASDTTAGLLTAAGLAGGFVVGLFSRPPDRPRETVRGPLAGFTPFGRRYRRAGRGPLSPRASLRIDSLNVSLAAGRGAVFSLPVTVLAALTDKIDWLVLVLAVVLIVVRVATASAWAWYSVTRFCHLGRGLPVELMLFLEDARARGVLRQHGAAYRFRHDGLRDALRLRQE